MKQLKFAKFVYVKNRSFFGKIHSMRVTEQKKVEFQNLQDEKNIQSDRSNYVLDVIATTSFADAKWQVVGD